MRHALLFLAVFAAGCGVSDSTVGQNEGEDTLEIDAELSASSRTFVGIRRDFRKCIAPLCGGYWVHDLNRVNLNEVFVSGLDFTGSGLTNVEQGQVELGLAEVVLRGRLGPKESQFGTRPFIVSEAYRGLPGKAWDAEQVFTVTPANIQCFRAPCPSLRAKRVNYTAQTLFHQLSLARAGDGLVDTKWLGKRVREDGALVAGTWARKGEELVLDAANVFVRLPELAGPCPLFRLAACPTDQVRTYTRSADRCILPGACVTPGVCAQYLPVCNEGYSLQSWAAGQHACPAFVCDPSWVVGEE